jgi:hypothetical protein
VVDGVLPAGGVKYVPATTPLTVMGVVFCAWPSASASKTVPARDTMSAARRRERAEET